MADEDDPYFGYNTNSLEPGYTPVPFLPNYQPPRPPLIGPKPFYYSDIQNNENGQTGDQGDGGGQDSATQVENADIELINKWIMGEQPGTTADRSQQWNNISQLLQNTADTLREQTRTLAENWESPGAKEVFLSKVGETLAYLRVWQDAAIKNSVALYGLSNVMYEAQAEMKKLYTEYAYVTGALQWLADKPGTVAPNGQYVDIMPQRKVEEEKEKYNQKARDLANRYIGEYAPYIAKLNAGRAKALSPPLDAIVHPSAIGVDIPTLPPPTPPGTPGANPPGVPNATPPGANPPGAPDATPPNTSNGQPPGTPPGDPNATPPTTNATPPAATPPATPELVPPGTPPATPNVTPPGVTPPDAPGVPPTAFGGVPPLATPFAFNGGAGKVPPNAFSANNLSPSLFSGAKTPPATPPTLGDVSLKNAVGAPPGGLPPSMAQNSLYPPGTITPPPGGQVPQTPQQKAPGENQPGIPSYGEQSFNDHLEMEAKAVAQQATASTPPPPLPPGTSMPNSREVDKAAPPGGFADGGYTEQAPAFQPPPTTAPPVLENNTKRTRRGGSTTEAPATPPGGLGMGAPPVLSNPHRKPPQKTFTEKQRERPKRPVLPGMPGSEFAANLPTGTTPVFDGRFSAEEYVAAPAGEIPNVLQAPTPVVVAPDRHAKPVVHADQAKRVARKDEEAPVNDESVFEVETPGGPVVAAGEPDKRYRPAEPSALDGRN
ncbi:hypothetical protein [Amycolatopsis thermoflava]|uniref:hypothetical protein n=1 Tax=Amycolatopsis thermoflava TaxID=84480 RepID=UPI0003F8BCE5|nr:hypothetical protein [Amycolatopsis thermoflava]